MQAQHSARDSSALSAARLSRPQPLLAWHLGLSTTVHRRAQGAGQGRPRHQAGRWFMASGHVGSSQTMGAEPAWLQGPGSAFPLPEGSGTRRAQRGEAGLTPPGWCGLVARAPRPDRPRVGRPGLSCTGGREGTQRWSRAEPRAVSALPPGHVVETLSLDLCPQRDLRTEGRTAALGLRGWPRQLQVCKQEAEAAADGKGSLLLLLPAAGVVACTKTRAAEAPGTPPHPGGSPASIPTSEGCSFAKDPSAKEARCERPSLRHFIRTGDARAQPRVPGFPPAPERSAGLVVLLSELESAVTARPGFCFFVLKKFKRPHVSTSNFRREHRRQTPRGCADPDRAASPERCASKH